MTFKASAGPVRNINQKESTNPIDSTAFHGQIQIILGHCYNAVENIHPHCPLEGGFSGFTILPFPPSLYPMYYIQIIPTTTKNH